MSIETLWIGAESVGQILIPEDFFSFDRCSNSGTANVKLDGYVFNEKSSFNMLELSFISELGFI